MATDAAGYSLGNAMKELAIDPKEREKVLTMQAREYGLQNWIIAAAMISDVDLNEIKQAASQSGRTASLFFLRKIGNETDQGLGED